MDVKVSLRSPLNRVRGLGSAKNGTHHWLAQRVTAAVLVPIIIFLVVTFVQQVVLGDYISTFHWIHTPLTGAVLILFLVAAFYHGVLGLQVVIEDYVHNEFVKMTVVIVIKLTAWFFAVIGLIAILRLQMLELS